MGPSAGLHRHAVRRYLIAIGSRGSPQERLSKQITMYGGVRRYLIMGREIADRSNGFDGDVRDDRQSLSRRMASIE
jgi:hypothetical protein